MVRDNAQDETESGSAQKEIEILESDNELDKLYKMELQQLIATTMETIETRGKLLKLRMMAAI